MRCLRCQADNAAGSRFCGHCGAPMPATAPIEAPAPPPRSRDDSLDGSIRVPVSRGARWAAIAIVLALDVAMAAAGIVLLTRGRGGGEAAGSAADAGATVGGGEVGGGGGTVGGGGGGGGTAGTGGAGTGTAGTGTAGTGGGTATAPRPDAGAATTRPPPDAGPATTPAPPDAAPPSPSPDASPPPDASTTVDPYEPDAPVDDRPSGSAHVIGEVGRQLARSQGRMERCYTQATKGLPEGDPLAGEVDIVFEVVPTGETRGVHVARNTTGSNQLAACLLELVQTWTFTAYDGAPLDLMRTFRFGPR